LGHKNPPGRRGKAIASLRNKLGSSQKEWVWNLDDVYFPVLL